MKSINFKSLAMTLSLVVSTCVLAYMLTIGSDKYVCIDDCVNTLHEADEPQGTAYVAAFSGPVMEQQTRIFMQKLTKIREQMVKGDRLILVVESPGGSMVMGNRVWAELQDMKRDGLTVIGVTEHYALSAGYLIISTGDKILSTDGAMVGNVGVYNKVPLAKKTDAIVIGTSREKELFGGDGVRSKNDIDIIRGRIMDMNKLFRTRILENRLMAIKDKGKAFNGLPYDSRQAIDLGLSDGHASVRDIARTAALNNYNVKHVFSRREMGLYF